MRNKLSYLVIFLVSLYSTAGIFFFYFPIKNVPALFLFIGLIFIFAVFSKVYKRFFKIFIERPNKQGWFVISFSALLAVLFLLSTRGPQDYLQDNSIVIVLLTYFGSFLFVAACIALIVSTIRKHESSNHSNSIIPQDFILYFMIIFLTGFVYLIAFYPAIMSPDSLSSWGQAHTKEFNDWHPIVFTWIIMILSYIWDSPAIVSLFQILVLSLILAYSFCQFQKLGINKFLLVIMSFIIAIIPSFGIYNIIIWKDVLFSASILIFTVHLFMIMRSKGKWLSSKINIIFFFLASFGVVFLRHNGFPIFVLTMLALLLYYWKSVWKIAGPTFLILVIAHEILTGPVFAYLDVKPSDPNEALSIPTQQIANIIKNDGNLTPEQLKYYNSIFPIEMWKEKYLPHTVDPIKFSWAEYNRKIIYDDFPKYFKTWGEVVVQNPSLAMEAFIKHTALVWQMSTPQYGYTSTYITFIMKNDYGLESKSINTSLTNGVTKYLEFSKAQPFVKLVWRPAFYAFFILLFWVVIFLKNGWKSTIVILPFLLNILSVAAAMPAQDFRYLFANVLLSFVFPFMALIHPKLIEES